MSRSPRVGPAPPDVVALSVHGPNGVLDLQVPTGASGSDVAMEYSRQAGLPSVPHLYTRLGTRVAAEASLADAGVGSGSVLVAVVAGPVTSGSGHRGTERGESRSPLVPGRLSALWVAIAVALAGLAGWYASGLSDGSTQRDVAVAVLAGTALLCALPLGPLAEHRVLGAPAFAGGAAFAMAWSSEAARLPTILGITGLVAAVAAAVARALATRAAEGLRVWILAGSALFVVTMLAALLEVPAQVVWAFLLLVAMLAARFVPVLAVDVPDQLLIDLERLAVTAWSARERPTGRRGRTIVPRAAVAAVAESGARTVTAASAAILLVSVTAAVLLVREAPGGIDAIGARSEVGLVGAGLLLAARSYRHVGARALLRAAGLGCWLVLAVELFEVMGPGAETVVATLAIAGGVLMVLVAVALGRGWRSAWWSRRAEVAEGLCGALAVASVVVAAGFFTGIWEMTS